MSKMDRAGSSEVLGPIYHLHGIASQKTAVLTMTAVRNSNVTKHFRSASQDSQLKPLGQRAYFRFREIMF
jgi:hypothetical protein